MTATLVLVRHGEIIRPPYTSNFDRAPLSERGERQIRGLARAWPSDHPSAVFASPLRRSIESAIILSGEFGLSISKRPCLKEWSADESGIPQPEYAALEKKAKGETPRVGPESFPKVPYPEPMLVPPPWEGGDGNSLNTPRRRPLKKETVA